MTKHDATWTFDNQQLSIPDVKIPVTDLIAFYPKASSYKPLRGHVYTLAVLGDDGFPVGWCLTTDLGYPTHIEWMKANAPEILKRRYQTVTEL